MEERVWRLRVNEHGEKHRLELFERFDGNLEPRGWMGEKMATQCMDAICYMLSKEIDDLGNPCRYESNLRDRKFTGKLKLGTENGAKLALLFNLQSYMRSPERVELMAWRIQRFTREEALYWLEMVTLPKYGEIDMAWAKAGLQTMLSGRDNDMDFVVVLLSRLRR